MGSPRVIQGRLTISFIILTAVFFTTIYVTATSTDTNFINCSWSSSRSSIHHPYVYFINMDLHSERRQKMVSYLLKSGYTFKRVRGMLQNDYFIPNNVQESWESSNCVYNTGNSSYITSSNNSNIVANLCGKANIWAELGCTLSHLVAIKKAVHSKSNPSKYALIMEDDMFIPFLINYDILIQYTPKDFGILQLFTSNLKRMQSLWDSYSSHNHSLWHPRISEDWSTGAYLINREVLRPIIDAIVVKTRKNIRKRVFNILAVEEGGRCNPSACCMEQYKQSCIHVDGRWIMSDYFIYSLSKTYISTIPIVTMGSEWKDSAIHPYHTILLEQTFQQQLSYIQSLYDRKVQLPSYMQAACTMNVVVNDSNTLL